MRGGEKMNNIQKALSHLKDHQSYPATRKDLIEECNKLSDFSKEDKEWFMANIPEGKYDSPEDVAKALGWQT